MGLEERPQLFDSNFRFFFKASVFVLQKSMVGLSRVVFGPPSSTPEMAPGSLMVRADENDWFPLNKAGFFEPIFLRGLP